MKKSRILNMLENKILVRKPIIFCFSLALFLTIIFFDPATVYAWSYGGSGTENDPYKVPSVDALNQLANDVNIFIKDYQGSDYQGYYFKQTANIVFPAGANNFTGIGSEFDRYVFKGSFDGGDFTISNININAADKEYQGLFGNVGSGGTVKNVHLVNNSITGNEYVGAIAGYNNGTIQNCSCQGTVIGSGLYVGGITGINAGTVENCSSNSAVSGDYDVGGITGKNDGNVRKCSNSNSVDAKNKGAGKAGGIVGTNLNIVQNCTNSGAVSSANTWGESNIGGIVGNNESSGIVQDCYNRGNVTGLQYCGGVMGYSNKPGTNNYFLKTTGINASLPGIAYRTGIKTSSNEGAEPKTAVADMQSDEFAYNLNTTNGTTVNSGVWSCNAGKDGGYPIFADADNKAIYKVTFNNEGTNQSKYSDYTGKISLPTTPASGETAFLGWYTAANGAGAVLDGTTIISQDLTVYADWDNAEAPVITKDLTAVNTTLGTAVTLDATASITDGGALSYAWYRAASADKAGSVLITTATGATYAPPVDAAGTFYYYCKVKNTKAGKLTAVVTSSVATVNITTNAAVPVINTQPTSLTVKVGDAANLSIAASGGVLLSYQWYSNSMQSNSGGSPISGATDAVYAVPTTTAGTNYYYCVVTNTDAGATGSTIATVTSSAATVIINTLTNAATPIVDIQPANLTVKVGDTANLTITASGGVALSYQWYSNSVKANSGGSLMPDVTSAVYAVPTITVGTTYYYCMVTNTDTSATGSTTATAASPAAAVTVNNLTNAAIPIINTQPANLTVNTGDTINLTIAASGAALSYQWYSNSTNANSGGSLISGATSPVYTAPANTVGTTYYYCVVTNTDAGATGSTTATATSNAAEVKVINQTPSGGSGSGGSSQSASPPANSASVSRSNTNEAALSVNVNGENASVNVGTLAGDVFSSQGNTLITIPPVSGVKAYAIEIPADNLTAAQSKGSLTVSTVTGSITITDNMLAEVSASSGKKAAIVVGPGNKTSLPDAAQAAIGDRPLVQLTLKLDGVQTDWNNPDAPVTVSIPYTPTAAELADPEHITVWYLDGNGNIAEVPSGRYDPATGKVTFTTTHFSDYAVVYLTRTFNDLNKTAWAKNQIEVLASKGILKGVSGTEYAPEVNITRADFLYSLVRTLGVNAKVNGNFEDVNPNAYYCNEVGIAKKLGITTGTGNNKFSPDAGITRQDMIVLTEKALKKFNKLHEPGTASDLAKFTDKSLIADYAADSIATAIKEGLIVGSDNMINPRGNTTRAEAAAFLYKIYKQ